MYAGGSEESMSPGKEEGSAMSVIEESLLCERSRSPKPPSR